MRGVRRGRLCGRGDRGHRHAPVRFLAHRFSTIEFRVTDVCLSVDEAVMVAGLFRGLARACSAEALAGTPLPRPRPELLRAATWRAAR